MSGHIDPLNPLVNGEWVAVFDADHFIGVAQVRGLMKRTFCLSSDTGGHEVFKRSDGQSTPQTGYNCARVPPDLMARLEQL